MYILNVKLTNRIAALRCALGYVSARMEMILLKLKEHARRLGYSDFVGFQGASAVKLVVDLITYLDEDIFGHELIFHEHIHKWK